MRIDERHRRAFFALLDSLAWTQKISSMAEIADAMTTPGAQVV
ncbi:MAG: hypothetical protein ACRD63_15605 [Pyrinomonadaceae bacterium]